MRVGGFEGEPYKLQRYVFDRQVLIEFCRQLTHIDKKYGEEHQTGVSFPIELTHYICNNVSDALNLELEFKRFKYQLYFPCTKFDTKGFAMTQFTFKENFRHVPDLEDFWADCVDEYEVPKRAHLRLTVQQIKDYGLKINTANIVDDENDLLDHQFVNDRQPGVIPKIDRKKDEEEQIQTRIILVIRRTEKWLRKKKLSIS